MVYYIIREARDRFGVRVMNRFDVLKKRLSDRNADFLSISADVDTYTMYDKDMKYLGSGTFPRALMKTLVNRLTKCGWIIIKKTVSNGVMGYVLARANNG